MKIKIFLSFCFLFLSGLLISQTINQTSNYILSGTVVNGETNELLIGANIISSAHFGTKTDETGVFSILVLPNDTLQISFIGYKTLHYITSNQEKGKYLTKFKLYTDSIILDEVEIFPWPSYEDFKKGFIELHTEEKEIKMEGIKLYQDRNIVPWDFTMINIFTSPISLIYDKLLDKKAKLRRQLERNRQTIKKSSFIKE